MRNFKRGYIIFRNVIEPLMGLLLFIILGPLMLLIALWIKLDSPGPIFFIQTRVGKQQNHFQMLKFRTMKIETPKNTPTHLLKTPDQWLTRSGRILRKTSLDELPQLWHIIQGKMSFIGPRPALWNQYDLIEARETHGVHTLKPGITGYAQVYGRDALEIPEKASLDGYYVTHVSLLLDLKILLKTISAVLKSDGVIEGGTGTMNHDKDDIS